MRRWIWMLAVLLLAGCGGTNAVATQTRTAEIVNLTVAARTLPTQNPAVPPTPSLSPSYGDYGNYYTPPSAPQGAATVVLPPTPLPISPADFTPNIPGSWIAYSPALRIRFFAPPSVVEDPEHTSGTHYALASPSNVFDFEALVIYRYVGARGGDFASTFGNEATAFSKVDNISGWTLTSGPRQQQVGAYQGNIGQFHYNQVDNGLPISGTMWVGAVAGDEIVIIYRCTPEREQLLDTEIAQVFRTIDFNAR